MFFNKFLFCVVFLLGFATAITRQRRALSSHVHDFESLKIDWRPYIGQLKTRRYGSKAPLLVNITVFDRLLQLELLRVGAFKAPVLVVDRDRIKERANLDLSLLPVYEGTVIGMPKSHVRGRIFNGIFEGTVHMHDDTFHFERATKFFPPNPGDPRNPGNPENIGTANTKDEVNTVAYKWSDVSFIDAEGRHISGLDTHRLIQRIRPPIQQQTVHQYKPFNYNHEIKPRSRRGLTAKQNTCLVKLISDHTFYEIKGGEAQAITTMDYVLNRVNDIYHGTDFFISNNKERVNLAPHSYLVYTKPGINNPVSNINMTAFETLSSISLPVWEPDACLVHLFTHRQFSNGILGLAWTADPKPDGNAGGICQKRVSTVTGEMSLNTGLSSSLNYGLEVPEAVLIATVAHEIGHNFGAEHDPPGVCLGDSSTDNYLMARLASTDGGNHKNNLRFSPCSIRNIREVLENKATCFTAFPEARCGNGVRENEEECDCGLECVEGSCCDTECHIVGTCSPLVGGCCTNQCTYANATSVCRFETGCLLEARCTGTSENCPNSAPKPITSTCLNDAFLCTPRGVCGTTPKDSVCRLYNTTVCTSPTNSSAECTVFCMFDGQCISTVVRNATDPTVKAAYYPGGFSCLQGEGRCNAVGECISIKNMTIDDVKDLNPFFAQKFTERILAVLRANWYWILAGILILIASGIVLYWLNRENRKERVIVCQSSPDTFQPDTYQPDTYQPDTYQADTFQPEYSYYTPSSASLYPPVGPPPIYPDPNLNPGTADITTMGLGGDVNVQQQAQALDMYYRQHTQGRGRGTRKKGRGMRKTRTGFV